MSYMGTHNRIRRVRGGAENFTCVTCGEQAREWALDNSSPHVITDAQGRRYSRTLDDYRPMCFRCHRLEDKASITHCPKGHAYVGENVYLDAGKRKCRACTNERNRQARRARPMTDKQRQRKLELQRVRRARERAA